MILEGMPFGRVRALTIPLPALLPLFVAGAEAHIRCTAGLPPDAQVLRLVAGPEGIMALCSHPTWDLIPCGHPVPLVPLRLQPAPPPGWRAPLDAEAIAAVMATGDRRCAS